MKRQTPETPLPQCVLDGVILSNRPTSVTTVWRDGDVVRQDAWGRARLLPAVAAISNRENCLYNPAKTPAAA